MSREKDRRWDEKLDKSLQVGLKKYSAMLDEAYAAADRLFADQRNEDANAVLGLILTGWELFKMQDDVLSLTRNKYRGDLTWSEQRVHDRLQSLKRSGFVLVDEKANEARRRRDNEARLKKARDDKQRQSASRNPRPRSKHKEKRKELSTFVSNYTKKHGIRDQQEWARRIRDGQSSVTVNALAYEFQDHLETAGFGDPPDRKTLRNWLSEYLRTL